jgi:sigma-E factor negative regulatory protein RseA
MTAARHPDAPDRLDGGALLSTLLDGEGLPDAAEELSRRWRVDEALRADWHVYHVIGDVLRSEELAGSVRRDAAFLQALRVRLAHEPVPLAPAPVVAPARPRRWLAPAAAAAGFVLVGAAVLVLQPDLAGSASPWGERAALAEPADVSTLRRVGTSTAPPTQTLVIDGQVIRDARLDAYFEAHRGAVGAAPSALPGGALRSVEILIPQR